MKLELEELPGEIKTEGRKQLKSLGADGWDVKQALANDGGQQVNAVKQNKAIHGLGS